MRAPRSNDPTAAPRLHPTTSTDTDTDTDTAERPAPRPAGSGPSAAGYTEGDVKAHVQRLTGFMMMGFLAMTLAQFIEAIYLGQVGTAELAAVAYTFPLTLGLNAMVRGVGIGASAVVARTLGSGDAAAAGRLISHCLLLVAGFAALFVAAALSLPLHSSGRRICSMQWAHPVVCRRLPPNTCTSGLSVSLCSPCRWWVLADIRLARTACAGHRRGRMSICAGT